MILTIHLHQMPKLKMCGAIPPVAYIPSWLGGAIIFFKYFMRKNAYYSYMGE
jgi:hypothetical protein